MNNTGSAPEIAQARVKEELAKSEDNAEVIAPNRVPEPPVTTEVTQADPTNSAGSSTAGAGEDATVNLDTVEKTGRLPLAALPDEELVALCNKYNVKIEGDGSREAVISQLGALGVHDVAATQA